MRFADLHDGRFEEELGAHGCAVLRQVLDGQECEALRALYAHDKQFRSRVVMARHGFGQGEYQYFAYPLPPLVEELRATLYPSLATIANRWNGLLKIETHYPSDLDEFLIACHAAGQTRPTALLLNYGEGDYNRLHQDLLNFYGALHDGRGKGHAGPPGPPCPAPRRPLERSIHVLRTADKSCATYRG